MTHPARTTPDFSALRPASAAASAAHRGSSKKTGTKPELAFRKELSRLSIRYRVANAGLPGRPDVAFCREKLAVFVDGDFWHGRNLEERIEKLRQGHNAAYWVAKIQRNVARDRQHDASLNTHGWAVLRIWESDIKADPKGSAARVLEARERASRCRRGNPTVEGSFPLAGNDGSRETPHDDQPVQRRRRP